jgi:hypothetical protein
METLTLEEITNEILAFIRNNYDYDFCDVFEDELQFTLEDGRHVNIYVSLEIEED